MSDKAPSMLVEPVGDRFWVEMDADQEVFGGGLIVKPETVNMQGQTATVVRVSESRVSTGRAVGNDTFKWDQRVVPEYIQAGTRVLLRKSAGTGYKLESTKGVEQKMVHTGDVLAVIHPYKGLPTGDIEGFDTTADVGVIPRLMPREGRMIVERVKMPEGRAGVILTDAQQDMTRPAEAMVLAENGTQFEVGQKVILAGSVQQAIEFGRPPNERYVWFCAESEVQGVFHGEGEEDHVRAGEKDPRGSMTSDDYDRLELAKGFAEGDPSGLR